MNCPDYLVEIVREGETIFWSSCKSHLPRVGERVCLAKWDTVYKVTEVVHYFGKCHDTHHVRVHVRPCTYDAQVE